MLIIKLQQQYQTIQSLMAEQSILRSSSIFFREVHKNEEIHLICCTIEDQLADMLTKSLSKTRFEILRSKIGVYSKRSGEC
jgi:hypothetical protein